MKTFHFGGSAEAPRGSGKAPGGSGEHRDGSGKAPGGARTARNALGSSGSVRGLAWGVPGGAGHFCTPPRSKTGLAPVFPTGVHVHASTRHRVHSSCLCPCRGLRNGLQTNTRPHLGTPGPTQPTANEMHGNDRGSQPVVSVLIAAAMLVALLMFAVGIAVATVGSNTSSGGRRGNGNRKRNRGSTGRR